MNNGLEYHKGNDIESLIMRGNEILGEYPEGEDLLSQITKL